VIFSLGRSKSTEKKMIVKYFCTRKRKKKVVNPETPQKGNSLIISQMRQNLKMNKNKEFRACV
jgi:hypothetical protein